MYGKKNYFHFNLLLNFNLQCWNLNQTKHQFELLQKYLVKLYTVSVRNALKALKTLL